MWRTCGIKTSIVRNRAAASARALERCYREGIRPFPGDKRLYSDVKHCQGGARLFSSRAAPPIQARDDKQSKVGNSRKKMAHTSAKQPKQPLTTDRNYDKVILRELVASIQSLQQRCDELEDLPPIWANSLPALDERRKEMFQETLKILGQIREHVKDGTLRPSGKHRHEVTVLFDRILKLYSESLSTDDTSVFEECTVVLKMMKEWKLELQHNHCEYAILAAGREERWKDAADLFWSHIDPEDSGYIPFDMDVSNPVGLYAIARFAQDQGTAVVENVFDGVLRMSMVSPTDQKKYILAAGTALGRAGEWEAFSNYLKTSYNASQLGQPLSAAAMHACLLCDRPNEALKVYDNLADGEQKVAGEWQWAGGQDRLDPLCRDLAMQALGGSTDAGSSTRAIVLFQQTEEDGVAASVEALHGVVCACENDGNWEEAVALLYSVLNRPNALQSLVIGSKLETSDLESSPQLSYEVLQEFGLVLNTVMQACNAAGQFGVALLCSRLVELALPPSALSPYHDLAMEQDEIVMSLVPVLCAMGNTDDFVATAMVSLCGVKCPNEAASVFKAISHKSDVLAGSRTMFYSQDVYDFARSEASRRKPNLLQETWPTAWRHIHRLTATFSIIKNTGEELAPGHAGLLSSALATTLRCCNVTSQAEAGLHLAKWVEGANSSHNSTEGMFGASLPLTDSLVSAVMEAYCATGNYKVALDLFDSQSITERRESHWMLSYNAALIALFSLARREDGIALFRKALAINRNPDMFCIAAKGFVDAKQWGAVLDLYRLALTSGCLSEELSKFALVSVAAGHPRDQTRGLRTIIAETAKVTGSNPATWIESKYWSLKRLLGFSTLRTLMWWHDPKTAHLDELELALSGLEKRATLGLTPKNDALRSIVATAKSFHEGYVPPDRIGLPSVPRDRGSWIETIARVLLEAKDTTLLDDPSFIDDVTIALRKLNCGVECVGVVNDALDRGVRLHRRALEEALEAAKGAEMMDSGEVFQMLMTDTTSSEQR